MNTLDLENATLVGHSIGGGEIARYVSRHGTARVAKAVLIAAPVPLMARTETNPAGVPLEIFDGIREALAENRSQFFKDLAMPFYGFNRPQAAPSQSVIDAFWAQGMSGGILAQYACVREFSEVDFTEDMKQLGVPTLLLHGDDDQNVPVEMSSRPAAALIANAALKVYAGASHGLIATHASQVNEDLLAFIDA